MNIDSVSSKDSILYLWGVWPQVPECLQVMKAWGFDFVSGFPWIKMTKSYTFQPVGGYWILGVSEYCLIGKKGKASPPIPSKRYLGIISPSFRHSKKPNSIHDMAETLPGPYLELFARESREGWTVVGNQIDKQSNYKKTNEVNMEMFK
jgi:N6-adenosine-specific RNA methylase IME4